MPSLENVSEADLKRVMKNSSLRRARKYVRRISNPVRQGQSLQARVQGSRLYEVEIDLVDGDVYAICTCPYDWGGYCKHIGAVLLKWMAEPNAFQTETAVSPQKESELETFPVDPPPATPPEEAPFWMQISYKQRLKQKRDDLHEWLTEYKMQDLRAMADNNGWSSVSGVRKDNLVDQIISRMLDKADTQRRVAGLDEEHRRVWRALSLLNPALPYQPDDLERAAKQWGSLSQYKKITTYTRHLCEAGLAIPGEFRPQYWGEVLSFIHELQMQAAPAALGDALSSPELPREADSRLRLADPRAFLQTANQILLWLEQRNPPLRRPMPRPRLEKFYEYLQDWDYVPEEIAAAKEADKLRPGIDELALTVPPPMLPLNDEAAERLIPLAGGPHKLEFYYHVLVTAGLLQSGSPVQVWAEGKADYLRRDEAGQWAILARAYLQRIMRWSVLWMILAERPQMQLKRSKTWYYGRGDRPEQLYGELAEFQYQVTRVLACLPDDRWVNIEEITAVLRPIWRCFDRRETSPSTAAYPSQRKPAWFLAENGRFLDTAKRDEDWDKAQGAFIRQMIQGPLHWLGLVDVSLVGEELVAFRPRGLADLFWERVETRPLPVRKAGAAAEEGKEEAETAVSISEFTIVVDPAALSAQAHNYLDNLARLEEAVPGRFVYRLDVAAVHQAFEAGETLHGLLAEWEELLPLAMPASIRQKLSDWWRAYGRVRLYQDVTVIEFGDEYALAEMKAATSLEKHIIAEISPRLALIPEKTVASLVAELEKAGYTPQQADDAA